METPLQEGTYLSEFKPIGGTWYGRVEATGEILETKVLVIKTDEWPKRREAGDPLWRAMKFGELTIALKMLL
jgi:hypothetical protein